MSATEEPENSGKVTAGEEDETGDNEEYQDVPDTSGAVRVSESGGEAINTAPASDADAPAPVASDVAEPYQASPKAGPQRVSSVGSLNAGDVQGMLKGHFHAHESLIKRNFVEFLGTMFLVMTVSVSLQTNPNMAPLAIGSILMVMIYAGGHISGGHFNPAVTWAVWLSGRNKTDWKTVLTYFFSQQLGAIVGAAIGYGIHTQSPLPKPGAGFTFAGVFGVETLYTFTLCNVVLNTATTRSQKGNSFFGMAIGFVVVAGAISSGKVSGATFNPAVVTGLATIHGALGGSAKYIWIYWVADFLGGIIAGLFFRLVNSREFAEEMNDQESEGFGAGFAFPRRVYEMSPKVTNWCAENSGILSALLTEFQGTFQLTLTISLTAAQHPLLAPLAIACILVSLVYEGGHISGGHFNPAITLGVWLCGSIGWKTGLLYMGVQYSGGIVGAIIGRSLTHVAPKPERGAGYASSYWPVIWVELLFTFALVMVVLNVATTKSQEGNSFFGLAIGFTVLAGAVAVGPISGAGLNPGAGIGLSIVNLASGGSGADFWIYLIAPLLGGAAAALFFRWTNAQEFAQAEPPVAAPTPGGESYNREDPYTQM